MIKKKTKKKNKILITLCAMFIAIASVFSFISFNKTDNLVVKADSTIVSDSYFEGSNLFFLFSPYNDGSLETNITFSYVTPSFTFDSNYNLKSLNLFFHYPYNGFENNQSVNIDIANYTGTYGNQLYMIAKYNLLSGQTNGSKYNVRVLLTPNSLNTGFVMGAPVKIMYQTGPQFGSMYTQINYYDNANNMIRIFIEFYKTSNYQSYYISPRTYYLNNYNLTDNEYYNQGYDAGLQNGYQSGFDIGSSEGYSEGYNIGNNIGYNQGYDAGLEDSNNYTFLSLLSATIDAPIKYFQSLFNFELLGVNLQGFLTGLFTLCVIVTIIKMVL